MALVPVERDELQARRVAAEAGGDGVVGVRVGAVGGLERVVEVEREAAVEALRERGCDAADVREVEVGVARVLDARQGGRDGEADRDPVRDVAVEAGHVEQEVAAEALLEADLVHDRLLRVEVRVAERAVGARERPDAVAGVLEEVLVGRDLEEVAVREVHDARLRDRVREADARRELQLGARGGVEPREAGLERRPVLRVDLARLDHARAVRVVVDVDEPLRVERVRVERVDGDLAVRVEVVEAEAGVDDKVLVLGLVLDVRGERERPDAGDLLERVRRRVGDDEAVGVLGVLDERVALEVDVVEAGLDAGLEQVLAEDLPREVALERVVARAALEAAEVHAAAEEATRPLRNRRGDGLPVRAGVRDRLGRVDEERVVVVLLDGLEGAAAVALVERARVDGVERRVREDVREGERRAQALVAEARDAAGVLAEAEVAPAEVLPVGDRGERRQREVHRAREDELERRLARDLLVAVEGDEAGVAGQARRGDVVGPVEPALVAEVAHEAEHAEAVADDRPAERRLEVRVLRRVDRQVRVRVHAEVRQLPAERRVVGGIGAADDVLAARAGHGVRPRERLEGALEARAGVARDDVDDARVGLPVLGVVGPRDDLELLDALVLDLDRDRAVVGVRHADAVDEVRDLLRAPAADVDARAARGDAGLRAEQVANLLDGQRVDGLGRDARLGRREVAADELGVGRHDDLVERALGRERDVGRRREVHVHAEALDALRRVADVREREDDRARPDADDLVAAVDVGRGALRAALDADGRADERLAGFGVGDGAGDLAGLGYGRRGGEEQDDGGECYNAHWRAVGR